MIGRALLSALVSVLWISHASADESQIRLKDGQGRDVVSVNCVLCHSLDYIPMNAPVMTPERWSATIRKMIDRLGAPIREEDVGAIQQYLQTNYVSQAR